MKTAPGAFAIASALLLAALPAKSVVVLVLK